MSAGTETIVTGLLSWYASRAVPLALTPVALPGW